MKLQALSLPLVILMAVTAIGMSLSVPGRAQTVISVKLKRVVKPDTPQNALLVDAVEHADLDAVQAALRLNASADTLVGQEGSLHFIPVGLMADQNLLGKRSQFLPIFRLLIQKVSDPNAADEDVGRTLLMAAVDMDDLDSVKTLVEKGADVNARQKRFPAGETALDASVMQGGVKNKVLSPITSYLLEHGATVNVADENGETVLMHAAGMHKTEAVQSLLTRGADPALRDKRGWTALRWAAERGWDDIVSLLQARSPMTLHEAAQFGDVARVRTHLDAGEDPNAADALGMTPLMEAMGSGSVETARLLLDRGADLKRTRKDGSTALHLAALCGDTALIGLLLDRGADVNAVTVGRSGPVTPLLNAVVRAEADAVALLLKRGADLKHGQGQQALELAVRNAGDGFLRRPRGMFKSHMPQGDAVLDARWRIINLLLSAGVDVSASHALFLAANDGQLGLIKLFLSKGADVNGRGSVGPEGTMDDGKTALMGAIDAWLGARTDEQMIKEGSLFGPELKDVHESENLGQQCVETLLAHGANASLPDARGKTPLMQCVSSGLPNLPKMLLAHGARIDAVNPQGITALMWAVAESNQILAALLLAHHAQVNLRDKLGRTALMLAIDDGSIEEKSRDKDGAGKDFDEAATDPSGGVTAPMPWDTLPNPDGHPAMVRLLLEHGASVQTKAHDGTTALRLARKHKFTAVTALLMGVGSRQ